MTQKEAVKTKDQQGRWYIIHTYSGMEERVKTNLEQRIASMDMKNRIFEVVIPTVEEVEIRDGKRTLVQRKLFPGYVLVRMIMDDQSWYVVRNTPGVTGFVSAEDEKEKRQRPLPLEPQEVEAILKQMQSNTPRIKVGFQKGQSVKITDGPFKEFIGVVDEIYPDKGRVKVLVSLFGRETPLELDFLQAEKL
ncbi:MAG: transcription termination/antitermination protein NusG [Chloroflexi bacterium]|nr:transcription termination/antitermination protein NusG [Chloroflexota bacterium]